MPMLGIMASAISGNLWAPAGAYDSISTATVTTGGATSVTFSSIPSTYTHLQIRANIVGTAGYDLLCQFNSDTATNYNFHYLAGNGATASAGAGTTTAFINISNNFMQGATIPGGAVVDILDYANTNKYKTTRALAGSDANGSGWLQLGSGLWRNTVAITSITVYPASSQSFGVNASIALYGIK